MSVALVLPDSIAGRADVLPPAFVCSWRDAGLDAAWVHVAGELDVATTPQLERTLAHAPRQVARRLVVLRGPPNVHRIFTLTGRVDVVESHDVDPVEPPVQVLLRLAEQDPAS
jgi:hypothetical protein